MLVNELYPTSRTSGGIELTDTWYNLFAGKSSDVDVAKPYYMGYIPWDEYPNFFKFYKLEFADNVLSCKPIVTPANIPWGYCFQDNDTYNQGYAYYTKNNLWEKSLDFTNVTTPSSTFINKINMASNNISQNFTIAYNVYRVNTNGAIIGYIHGTSMRESTISIYDLISAVENGTDISLINSDGNYVNVKYDRILKYETEEYTDYFFIQGFNFATKVNLQSYYNSGSGYECIYPFAKIQLNDEDFDSQCIFGMNGYRYFYNSREENFSSYIATSNSGATFTGRKIEKYPLGLYDFEVNFSDLPTSSIGRYIFQIDTVNGILRYGYSSLSSSTIYTSIDLADIVKYSYLYNKVYHNSYTTRYPPKQNTYDEYAYTSIFTDENVPENRRILGNLTTIISELQKWQLPNIDITANTFDIEKDLPPYDEDSGDDPDSDKEVKPAKVEGENILLQLNARLNSITSFVTLYNITLTQLSKLGTVLWGSVADYDPSSLDEQGNLIHNFYVRLGQDVTGTFDTSAILNYFISLRIFPFSVGTLPNLSTASGNNIYIGNGKVGIPISSTVRVMTSSIGILDAGVVLAQPITPYNDFRDYYNTTVTAILPYCGTVELNPTEVMNKTLHCYYAIDFYTGECTAYIVIEGDISYITASSTGVIGVQIPMSATSETQLIARHTMDDLATIKMVQSTLGNFADFTKQALTGQYAQSAFTALNMIGGLASSSLELQSNKMSRSGVSAPLIGGGSNGTSFFMPDSAYLQIRRGTYSRAKNYPHTMAYPNTSSDRLENYSGLTICYNVDVSNLNCTSEEQNEIKSYLENGIYV